MQSSNRQQPTDTKQLEPSSPRIPTKPPLAAAKADANIAAAVSGDAFGGQQKEDDESVDVTKKSPNFRISRKQLNSIMA